MSKKSIPYISDDDKEWGQLEAAYASGLEIARSEIIRCKDCKHWDMYGNECDGWCYELNIISPTKGYCYLAEEKIND